MYATKYDQCMRWAKGAIFKLAFFVVVYEKHIEQPQVEQP